MKNVLIAFTFALFGLVLFRYDEAALADTQTGRQAGEEPQSKFSLSLPVTASLSPATPVQVAHYGKRMY